MIGRQIQRTEQRRQFTPRVFPRRERLRHQMKQLVVNLPCSPANQIRDDEDGRRNPFPLQDWKRLLVVIAVPVIECQRDPRQTVAGGSVRDFVERRERMTPDKSVPLEHGRDRQ